MSWEDPPDEWNEQENWPDEERWDEGHPLDEEEHPEDFYELRAQQYIEQDPAMVELAAIAETGRDYAHSLAATPTEWAWQDYAPAGAITVLAGPPGCGKTTLLFQVLAARARTDAESCRVCNREVYPAPAFRSLLLIEAEHSSASTARKLIASCELVDVDDRALDRIIWIARKSVLIGDGKWKLIEQLIAAGSISDVAIDTLARASPRGAESNDEMSQVEVFDMLAQAIERAPDGRRPTVWLLAHTRKQSGKDKPKGKFEPQLGLDDVSGSLQRTGQADSVITVEAERCDGRVTATHITLQKAREEPNDYPAVHIMRLPGADHGILDGFSRVHAWRDANPDKSAKEGAKELGMRYDTFLGHLREIDGG